MTPEDRRELERRAKAFGLTTGEYIAELIKAALDSYDRPNP